MTFRFKNKTARQANKTLYRAITVRASLDRTLTYPLPDLNDLAIGAKVLILRCHAEPSADVSLVPCDKRGKIDYRDKAQCFACRKDDLSDNVFLLSNDHHYETLHHDCCLQNDSSVPNDQV